MKRLRHPVPLTRQHDRSEFDSGHRLLDSWLRTRALKNETSGASRTFVTTQIPGDAVAGYYTLAASAVAVRTAPGSVRRNMPDPVPVILLGRLAVDHRFQGSGIGASLLRDAMLRVVQASHVVGVRALLVHAIDENAAAFYQRFGFIASPLDTQTLMLPITTLRSAVEDAAR